ncbi:MAG TPA: hypothetical protein VN112_23775 [Ensifer sp.]|nr:hypothetical protein [Ensifer sp.]
MTGIQLFAFVVLPLSLAAAGVLIAYFYGRSEKNRRMHPGE